MVTLPNIPQDVNRDQRSTRTDIQGLEPLPADVKVEVDEKARCKARGGFWNEALKVCIMPPAEPTEPVAPPEVKAAPALETFKDVDTGKQAGITLPDGRTFLGLTPDDVAQIAAAEQKGKAQPLGTAPVGTAQRRAEQAAIGQQLAGQVGQTLPSSADATPIDFQQAATQGVVGAIPNAIRLAGQFGATTAAIGGVGGTVAGPGGAAIGATGGAIIGAATGFVSGIVGGIISDVNSQRTDNTNAQQRVLDEGKQTLSDWVTLARSDPANRPFYLTQFNVQLQQIQNAHVQMLTDTNADIGKFESAIPNLAEFDTFYSFGGERDALIQEMQIALQTPSSVEYEMLALANRRNE